ncbi:hypothetical protein, partial [uncultured Brachyspira sp.]|uniref:hypothetical protein n=1 Tax=uncultured Brachyspira sp. TaxID=221953 RepID=UPI0025D2B3DD
MREIKIFFWASKQKMSTRLTKFLGDIEFQVDGKTKLTSNLITSEEAGQLIQDSLKDFTPSNTPSTTDSNFTLINGIDKFMIENQNISLRTDTLNGVLCNVLLIDVPEITKQKFLTLNQNIFKVVLRKNVIYDEEGRYIKEFYISTKDNTIKCPIITYDSENNYCIVNDNTLIATYAVGSEDSINLDDKFYIAFDKNLSINPYTLFINGDLSILNQFEPTCLTTEKSIKCSTIEAENALKLHKSDAKYFYRPQIITEETVGEIPFYKMIYQIPDDYVIPEGLEFKFKDFCFDNSWYLTWSSGEWKGQNCQGLLKPKSLLKCNSFVDLKDANDMMTDMKGWKGKTCCIMMKRSEGNIFLSPKKSSCLIKDILINGNVKCQMVKSNGEKVDASSEYKIWPAIFYVDNFPAHEGYDIAGIVLKFIQYNIGENETIEKKIQKEIHHVEISFKWAEQSDSCWNTLSFKVGDMYVIGSKSCFALSPIIDTIESTGGEYSNSNINSTSKNIELYLNKYLVDPIEEVNWDPSTNPFEYIMKQQYFEVYPNPNAASTLYTDYNICSSKIISADNISTMRSDLNLLTNSFDVVSYDVKEMGHNVDVLKADMTIQKEKTQYLQSAVNAIQFTQKIQMAMNLTRLGIGITQNLISFAGGAAGSIGQVASITKVVDLSDELSDNVSLADSFTSAVALADNNKINLNDVLEWCNLENRQVEKFNFTEEEDNPDTSAVSLTSAVQLSFQMRNTIKPYIKKIVEKINEIDSSNSKIEELSNEYIKKSDLTRSDTIDIISRINEDQARVLFQAEDNLENGICVFKLFTSEGQKRFYFKIEEGEIVDYQGVDTTTTIDDITIEGLQNSEEYKTKYLENMNKTDNIIFIKSENSESKIIGCVIEKNTFSRNLLEKTPADIAYLSDIEALDEKIKALAVNSHQNDVAMMSLRGNADEEYPTTDEVNAALETIQQELAKKPDIADLYT